MKKIVKILINIFLSFVIFLSRIYSYYTNQQFKKLRNRIYTTWIASEFRKLGYNSYINSPIELKGGKYISIGSYSGIGSNTILTAWDSYMGKSYTPEITIGNNVWIGEDCHITSINNISIGNGVLLGKKITITDNSHGDIDVESLKLPPTERKLVSKGQVIIEDNVWIGDKATILPNVTIGRNSIIGANSVVTKNVPMNCVVAGNPARIIKQITLE